MSSEGSFCPSCGGDKVTDEVCPECNFSFATVLKCPFLDEDGRCKKQETICHVIGVGYEACPSLREF